MNRIQIKERASTKIIYSLTINLIIISVFIIYYSLGYEMPDNLSYAQFIAEGDYTFDYMGYFICAFLGLVQNIIYPINSFVVFHLLFSYISFTLITIVFVDKFRYLWGTCFSLLLFSFYAVSHYGNISFTRDPALFCCAGFLFIIHFINKKHTTVPVLIGCFMILIGSMYRFLVFEVCVFIAVVFIMAESISKLYICQNKERRFKQIVSTIFTNKRFIVLLIVTVVCFAVQFTSIMINTSTPDLSYYREYTYARQAVYDYPIPDYTECKSEYDKLNFDENDIAMLRAWYLDDDGAFTLDNLKEIKRIRDEYYSQHKNYFTLAETMIVSELSNIKAIGDKGVALFGFILVLVPFLLINKKRYYIIPVFLSISIFLLYFYLWNTDRKPPYRGVYMLWLSSEVYLMYSFSTLRIKEFWRQFLQKSFVRSLVAVLIILCSMLGFYLSITANYVTNPYNDYSVFKITKDTDAKKQTFGFNNTYYKYTNYERHMNEFGTDNMFANLLNDNVYFVCVADDDHSKIMKEYLNKYYNGNSSIMCRKIKTLNNQNELIKYYTDNPDKKFELSRASGDISQYIIYQFTKRE